MLTSDLWTRTSGDSEAATQRQSLFLPQPRASLQMTLSSVLRTTSMVPTSLCFIQRNRIDGKSFANTSDVHRPLAPSLRRRTYVNDQFSTWRLKMTKAQNAKGLGVMGRHGSFRSVSGGEAFAPSRLRMVRRALERP